MTSSPDHPLSDVHIIERSLILGRRDISLDLTNPVCSIVRAVIDGSYKDVLTSSLAKKTFRLVDEVSEDQFTPQISIQVAGDRVDDELLHLSLAISCLHLFVQENWTGPDTDIKPIDVLTVPDQRTSEISEEALNQSSISALAYGGEPAYHLCHSSTFLLLARMLLDLPYKHLRSPTWWKLRFHIIHQQILDEPVVLPQEIIESFDALQSRYLNDPEAQGRLLLEIGLLHHIFSQERISVDYYVRAARATGLEYELTGALGKRTKFQEHDLSQLVLLAESKLPPPSHPSSTSLSQSSQENGITHAPAESQKSMPSALPLNDDTLLERTQFTSSHPSSNPDAASSRLSHLDPNSQPPLHPLDQCILFSLCLNLKNTSPAHGLTAEEMMPYITRVLSHPQNWSVHTMALLLRSRLESDRTRTVDRSVLQLQALVDQMPTADSAVSERLLYIHDLSLPSKWDMQRELAARYISLGVVKSALEIYERLEMYEEVVKCYASMERGDQALAVVKDLLEGKKTESEQTISKAKAAVSGDRRNGLDSAREAKLWCLLGDLEPSNAVKHYTHAWEISKHTSGRAMRSLGGYYFAKGEYQNAVDSLKQAVKINPLLMKSWFILGCAAIRLEDWETARDAFVRCVGIDEEDAESWNNLASMYLRLGTKKEESEIGNDQETNESDPTAMAYGSQSSSIPFQNKLLAFRALKQGLKFSYENWRMWSNYMIVAMDVGELSEACRALGRIIEETSSKVGIASVDQDVLERLVDAVTRVPFNEQPETSGEVNGGYTISPNEGHGLFPIVKQLLDKTILPSFSSPRIFRAYARLLTWQSKWTEALKAYLDAYRCGIAGNMEKGDADVVKWREAAVEVEDIVDILRNFGPRAEDEGADLKWRSQAKSILRTFMGRTKEFEDEPEWEKLIQLQEELKKDQD